MAERLVLARDDWTLELRADVGGAVASLRHRDRAVLRPSPPQFRDALQSASFALVPYANRIAHGRFDHGGRSWQLPLNFGAHPHALHGVGWQACWNVTSHCPDAIVLCHEHDGGPGWPWPYVAEQRIDLVTDVVTFELTVVSRAEMPMPVGLGFHPAFPVSSGTVLRTNVGAVWLTDADQLPTGRAAENHFADWRAGAPVQRNSLIDHCHDDWERRLTITTSGMTTLLRASPDLDRLHIYVPPDADFFCAEPVSHVPDAINRATAADTRGLRLLPPGGRFGVSMQIAVEEAAPV